MFVCWLGVVGRLVCHVGWLVVWSAIILESARSYTSMLLSEHVCSLVLFLIITVIYLYGTVTYTIRILYVIYPYEHIMYTCVCLYVCMYVGHLSQRVISRRRWRSGGGSGGGRMRHIIGLKQMSRGLKQQLQISRQALFVSVCKFSRLHVFTYVYVIYDIFICLCL